MDSLAAPVTPSARSDVPPLVVDLDGTLVRTDMLVETVLRTVKRSPAELIILPWRMIRGRAKFKQAMAERCSVAVDLLPYHEPLVDYLRSQKAAGRQLMLATAADGKVAHKVAEHLQLFGQVLCSDGVINLKGADKLDAIRAAVGERFAYAGDSSADLPIWRAASGAVLVNAPRRLAAVVRRHAQVEREFPPERRGAGAWMRALRVHQWVKNLMLFVPLLTAFGLFDAGRLATMAVAFFAFSLAASATYLVNDMWDLDSDRAHPRKRKRPFASGVIPLTRGLVAAGLGLTLAAALALMVSPAFFGMLLVYLLLTSAYSIVFKEYVLIDVILLASLYTFRILAGAVVAQVPLTPWLLAFSMFLFLSLALVKRCAELVTLAGLGRISTCGRDYRVSDLVVLWSFGVGSALAAAVIFGMFVSLPATRDRYATPDLLWLVAIGLIYWLGRLWVKTSRDEMHDDPIIFAMRDRGSRVVIAAMILVTLASQFLPLDALL